MLVGVGNWYPPLYGIEEVDSRELSEDELRTAVEDDTVRLVEITEEAEEIPDGIMTDRQENSSVS